MISGPQICKMVACFKEKTKHYLVYELLTGGELFDEIVKRADTGISEIEVSSWMKQLFLALKECHDKEIVHRDVKLENLMLVDESKTSPVKLADFGPFSSSSSSFPPFFFSFSSSFSFLSRSRSLSPSSS